MVRTNLHHAALSVIAAAFLLAPAASAQVSVTDLGSLESFENGSAATDLNNRGDVVGLSQTDSFAIHAFFWNLDNGMVDLGTLEGADESVAHAINDLGQVVGESERAFLWTEGGGMIDLGSLDGVSSEATDINNLGQVVGISPRSLPLASVNPFFWSEATGMVEIGPPFSLSDFFVAEPLAVINDLGQVAFSGQNTDAFLWSQDGGLVPIGTSISVWDINDHGQVVGRHLARPFLWSEAEGMRDLGTGEVESGTARAINEKGQVVGFVRTQAEGNRPFIWTVEDGLIILEALLGGESFALDINDLGVVAGLSDSSDLSERHPFLWTEESGMVDLGTLGGPSANDPITINDLGQVVGQSSLDPFITHAALWGETLIADLWLEQSVLPLAGGTIRLTLTVHSAAGCRAAEPEVCGFGATVDAENVVLTDPLPLNPGRFEVVSLPPSCDYQRSTHTVTCQAALLPRDSSVSLAIEVRVRGPSGNFVNTATVSSDTFDSNPDNNTVTLSRTGS